MMDAFSVAYLEFYLYELEINKWILSVSKYTTDWNHAENVFIFLSVIYIYYIISANSILQSA